MNLYEQQKKNKRITALLIFAFLLLLGAVGFLADKYYFYTMDAAGGIPVVTLAALGLAGANSFVSYFYGDKLVLSSLRAVPLNFEDLSHKKLHNIVTEMALASGLPMPKVYVIEDPAPNAFATGRNPQNASIGVTEGLINIMNRDELQGVIAHEMSHIKNYDIRTMTVVTVLLGTIVLLSDWAGRSMFYGRQRRDSRKKGGAHPVILIILLLLVILSPILSRIIAMAVSRQREYLADASAAEITRYPLGLAGALEKISKANSPVMTAHKGTAHLFISDPLHRKLDDKEGLVADILSTHPPIEKRIEILKGMAYIYTKK